MSFLLTVVAGNVGSSRVPKLIVVIWGSPLIAVAIVVLRSPLVVIVLRSSLIIVVPGCPLIIVPGSVCVLLCHVL